MTTSEARAEARSIMKAGLLCGVAAPLFGLTLLFVLAGLRASFETTLAPGVTPMPWPKVLTVMLYYAFVSAGLPAAVLGAGGARLVLGLRRRGATPFVAALASAFIGAIAGLLWCSLVMGAWRSLTPRNPYTVTAAVTGMALGFGVWLMIGRQHRA
jgi:hypothetical protein